MDYQQAVESLTAELRSGDPADDAVGAGIRLALMAWQHIGAVQTGWDRFGLELLAIDELLPGIADVTVGCPPPDPDDPAITPAVAQLLEAVAGRFDAGAADPTASTAQRLAWDAAGIRTRTAVGLLP